MVRMISAKYSNSPTFCSWTKSFFPYIPSLRGENLNIFLDNYTPLNDLTEILSKKRLVDFLTNLILEYFISNSGRKKGYAL